MSVVGVEGKWIVNIDIVGNTISREDVIKVVLVEKIGNILPTATITLQLNDPEIADHYLSTGTEITLSLGKDKGDMENYKLSIFNVSVLYNFSSRSYIVIIEAVLNNHAYMNKQRIRSFKDKNSIEVLNEVLGEFFKDITEDKPDSNDKMTWIQPSITDWRFVNHLWLSCYVDDKTLILPSITAKGEYILLDVYKKLSKKETDWRLMDAKTEKGDDVAIIASAEYACSSEFLTSQASNRKPQIWDMLKDEITEETNRAVQPSGGLYHHVDDNLEKKYLDNGFYEDNMHKNFWRAQALNRNKLAALLGYDISVVIYDDPPMTMKIGDSAQVQMTKVNQERPQEISEFFGGVYIITEIVKVIEDTGFYQTIRLNRVGMGG